MVGFIDAWQQGNQAEMFWEEMFWVREANLWFKGKTGPSESCMRGRIEACGKERN
jgi:hypothetical protein